MQEFVITIGIPTAAAIIGALIPVMRDTHYETPTPSAKDGVPPKDIHKEDIRRLQWSYGFLGLIFGYIVSLVLQI